MTWRVARTCLVVCIALARPAIGVAQQATIAGIVSDESKGVLPGATVTATAVDTTRQFIDTTTAQGEYRLAGLPAGRYNVQVELEGFATTQLRNVEILVGQNATIPLTMKLASVTESVTVNGQAPIVDVQQARVAGNVDRRQMEEIPISGRNWQQL